MINENKIWLNQFNKFKKLPHILPKTSRIIAIGDLHGNLKDTIKILLKAKIIDKKFK